MVVSLQASLLSRELSQKMLIKKGCGRKTLLGNKKGQSRDFLAIIVFLFVFALVTIFSTLIYTEFTNELSSTDVWNDDMASADQGFRRGLFAFDYIIVAVMVILIIGVAVTTYKLATPPVFFLVNFITGLFYGFISYFFNFIFAQIVSQPQLLSVVGYFPRTILILTNLHWVMLTLIVVGSLTLYAKRDTGGGQFQ